MGPSGTPKKNSGRAKLINNTVAHCLLLPCVVLAFVLGASNGQADASSSRGGGTIHFPLQSEESKLGFGFHIIDATVSKAEDGARILSHILRSKRATDNPVDPENRTTVAHLNDSHTTLMVHWVGAGSPYIIALAKSAQQGNSALFISKDYGKTYKDVSSQLMVTWFRRAVISNYYSVRSFNNYYIFTDETNQCIFTTDNSGENFVRHCDLPFKPRVVKPNMANPRLILAMDDQSDLKQLYLTEDFGETWRAVYSRIKTFYWGVPPYENETTIFVVEELPATGKMQVVRSGSLFHSSYDTNLIVNDVVDFEIQDVYMFATKSVNLLGSTYNPHLQLWVSYKRSEFVNSEFPDNHAFTDFYVADASEGQLMVCAYINNSYSNLYVSDVTGYKFSLSLERIVYFNPKTIRNHSWLRLYSNETFADITKLLGVSGIYIASQQTSDHLEVEEQQTMITYDKGGKWQMINAPEYGISNRPLNCKVGGNCSLHLTQQFHRLYPGNQSYPILTQRSSPGLVMASGILGKALKGDPDVFVSNNAGITWRQALSGNYFYASADHGGIIVAAHQFIPTDEVV